jgi:hypothetical protein
VKSADDGGVIGSDKREPQLERQDSNVSGRSFGVSTYQFLSFVDFMKFRASY